jgi:hypothetical protein
MYSSPVAARGFNAAHSLCHSTTIQASLHTGRMRAPIYTPHTKPLKPLGVWGFILKLVGSQGWLAPHVVLLHHTLTTTHQLRSLGRFQGEAWNSPFITEGYFKREVWNRPSRKVSSGRLGFPPFFEGGKAWSPTLPPDS